MSFFCACECKAVDGKWNSMTALILLQRDNTKNIGWTTKIIALFVLFYFLFYLSALWFDCILGLNSGCFLLVTIGLFVAKSSNMLSVNSSGNFYSYDHGFAMSHAGIITGTRFWQFRTQKLASMIDNFTTFTMRGCRLHSCITKPVSVTTKPF